MILAKTPAVPVGMKIVLHGCWEVCDGARVFVNLSARIHEHGDVGQPNQLMEF